MKFSLDEHLKVVSSLLPASRSGASAVEGSSVDRKGFQEALVVLHQGAITGSGTNDVIVEESADGTTWSAVTSAVFSQKTASNDNTIYVGRLNLQARMRYLRAKATDAVAAVVCSVEFILAAAKALPVTQPETIAFDV